MNDDTEMDDFFENDNFDEEPAIEDDKENGEDALNKLFDDDEKKGETKKRTVQRPQPKLNEMTLCGPKGIAALKESFHNYKPTSKDPYENLACMMKKYEHWTHVMFPKMKFEDVVNRCETLGEKRMVKVFMMKSRLDMPLTDEDFAAPTTREKAIIKTEYSTGEIREKDNDDDEENYYDPLDSETKSSFANDHLSSQISHIPEYVRKAMEEARQREEEEVVREAMLEEDRIRRQQEDDHRRMEELAAAEEDEIMADFDF